MANRGQLRCAGDWQKLGQPGYWGGVSKEAMGKLAKVNPENYVPGFGVCHQEIGNHLFCLGMMHFVLLEVTRETTEKGVMKIDLEADLWQ